MADDVYVKETGALINFARELRSVGSNMEGYCTQLSGAIYMKEGEMRAMVDRIEYAFREAEQEVESARREYEAYIYDTDRDSYSEYEARVLLENLQVAETRYAEVERDLNEAVQVLREACDAMVGLENQGKRFSLKFGQLICESANIVDRAVYNISQYNTKLC